MLFLKQALFYNQARNFVELAGIAAAHSGPRAPRFYIQAGRAYIHAGETQEGMACLEKGYQLLLQTGRSDLAARIGWHISEELKVLGLDEQTHVITAWFGGIKPLLPTSTSRPPLPLKCPSCGGPVFPDELTWLDSSTAQCDFCGNPLRNDSSSTVQKQTG